MNGKKPQGKTEKGKVMSAAKKLLGFVLVLGFVFGQVVFKASGQDTNQGEAGDQSTAQELENQSTEGFLNTPTENSQVTAARQNARQTLLAAVDKLTPGAVPADSDLEKSVYEAIDIFLKNDVEGSLEKLKEIRTAHPVLPPAEMVLSGFLFTAGDNANGLRYLESAATNSPDYPSTYSGFSRIAINQNRLTDAYALCQVAQEKIANGDWSDEQKNFFRIEVLDSLADISIKRLQWDSALQHLNEVRILLPENGKITLKMAQVHFEREEVDKSLENLNITAKLSTDLRKPEVIIADWFLVKRNIEESKKWLDKAVENYPADGEVFLARAQWLMRNNQFPQAAEAATKAEELGADGYQVTFVKGQIAFVRRAYDIAEMHFSKLNQLRPGDVESSNLLTLALIESENPDKIQKALQLATMNQRVYPRNTAILATLGWVYFKTGNLQQAQQIFQSLVNVRPMPQATGYFVANFLNERGEKKAASVILKATLESDGFYIYRARAKELYDQLMAEVDKSGNGESNGEGSSDQSDQDKNGSPTPADDG